MHSGSVCFLPEMAEKVEPINLSFMGSSDALVIKFADSQPIYILIY